MDNSVGGGGKKKAQMKPQVPEAHEERVHKLARMVSWLALTHCPGHGQAALCAQGTILLSQLGMF